eukprot:11172828-Lingulodinium_polyedra.AAC.1
MGARHPGRRAGRRPGQSAGGFRCRCRRLAPCARRAAVGERPRGASALGRSQPQAARGGRGGRGCRGGRGPPRGAE